MTLVGRTTSGPRLEYSFAERGHLGQGQMGPSLRGLDSICSAGPLGLSSSERAAVLSCDARRLNEFGRSDSRPWGRNQCEKELNQCVGSRLCQRRHKIDEKIHSGPFGTQVSERASE